MQVLERRERAPGSKDVGDALQDLLRDEGRQADERKAGQDMVDRQHLVMLDNGIEVLGRSADAGDFAAVA